MPFAGGAGFANEQAARCRRAALGVKRWKVENPAELLAVLKPRGQGWQAGEPALFDIVYQTLYKVKAPVTEWVG